MTALQAYQGKQLADFISKIERLEEEKAATAGDIRELYAAAKAKNLCPKTIRKIVALRKKPKAEREEEEALLEQYLQAISWPTTPLGATAERPMLRAVAD